MTFVELNKTVSFREVCDHIQSHCRLFDAPLVKHVTAKVVEVVTELVAQNNCVCIDGLGRFKPSVTKEGKMFKVGVTFLPERNTFMRLMKEQKLKEITPDCEIYPQYTPITSEEQKRRRRKLQREEGL